MTKSNDGRVLSRNAGVKGLNELFGGTSIHLDLSCTILIWHKDSAGLHENQLGFH